MPELLCQVHLRGPLRIFADLLNIIFFFFSPTLLHAQTTRAAALSSGSRRSR
jgi:hypothetical protein